MAHKFIVSLDKLNTNVKDFGYKIEQYIWWPTINTSCVTNSSSTCNIKVWTDEQNAIEFMLKCIDHEWKKEKNNEMKWNAKKTTVFLISFISFQMHGFCSFISSKLLIFYLVTMFFFCFCFLICSQQTFSFLKHFLAMFIAMLCFNFFFFHSVSFCCIVWLNVS